LVRFIQTNFIPGIGTGGGSGGGTAGASGADGAIQFATAGALNSDTASISFDNATKVFALGKITSGQVAELGNVILRNRGANDFALKHKLFNATTIDDNVGFGQNTGGKITIGATLDNSIDFLTGDGIVAPILRMLITGDGIMRILGVPTHTDEAAAVTGGLTSGDIYKTATGELRIKL